jgi:hypothetical protein
MLITQLSILVALFGKPVSECLFVLPIGAMVFPEITWESLVFHTTCNCAWA